VVEIIEAYAAQGDVLLVGRGSQVVLGQRSDVLHVRITAPIDVRCAAIRERCKVSAEVATARIAASDAARAGYHKRHFGVRWDDGSLFDIILNMARLRVAAATDIVCAAAEAQARQVFEAVAEGVPPQAGCES
jgi:cytidylate kinase